MKRSLIASFVFAQIYAQLALYDSSRGINKLDAMVFAPAIGTLSWIFAIGLFDFVLSLLKEMEKKQ